METKRCPYCGEEILIVAKKCKHCGEWLTEHDDAVRKTEAETAPVPPAPPAKKKTYSKPYVPKWLLIVVTVLAVIGSILSSIATANEDGEFEFGVLSFLFDTALAIVGIVVAAKAGERWRNWGITYFAATIVGGLLALSGNDYLSVSGAVLLLVFVTGFIVALYKNGRKSLGEQWLNMLGLTVLVLFAVIAGEAIVASVGKELDAAVVAFLMLLADLLGYIVIFNLLDKVNSEEKTTFIDYYFKTLCKIWLVLIAVVAVRGITGLRGKKPHRRIDRMAQTIGIADEDKEDDDDEYRRGEVFEPVEEVSEIVPSIKDEVPPAPVYPRKETPQYFFDGKIDDRIDIQMGIGMGSGSKYCYMKYGPDNSLTLKVTTYDGNHLVMEEYNSEGIKTGTWDGNIYHERYGGSDRAAVFYYKGTVDFNGKEMSFCLYEVPVEQSVYNNEPFVKVEQMPSFQGGDLNTFRNWVQQNVHYPQIAQENGISGRVLVSFVIEKDGTLTNIQVLQSPDRSLSDEAARVLQKSPKWKPGKQRNQAVRVEYILPVDFRP